MKLFRINDELSQIRNYNDRLIIEKNSMQSNLQNYEKAINEKY
jgi:hypothetical protein